MLELEVLVVGEHLFRSNPCILRSQMVFGGLREVSCQWREGRKCLACPWCWGKREKKKFFLKEIVKNENVKCRNELIR